MKLHQSLVVRGASVLTALALLAGCNKAANNAMTETGAAAASSGASSALATGATLFSQLGGTQTVKQLVGAFGVNISKSATLSKLFDAAAIAETQLGLTNEIAKVSGLAPPNPGVDLRSTLSGKGLDAAGAAELTSALSAAADEVKVPEPTKTALVGVLTPITTSLVGTK